MSNKLAQSKANRVVLANLIAVLDNGTVVHMDTTKVMLVDIKTGKPVFEYKETK